MRRSTARDLRALVLLHALIVITLVCSMASGTRSVTLDEILTMVPALLAAGVWWACVMLGNPHYTASQVLSVIVGDQVPGAS